jgi:hypothetical protein
LRQPLDGPVESEGVRDELPGGGPGAELFGEALFRRGRIESPRCSIRRTLPGSFAISEGSGPGSPARAASVALAASNEVIRIPSRPARLRRRLAGPRREGAAIEVSGIASPP